MNASFTPTDMNGNVMTLDAAAQACGFTEFDWTQTINQSASGSVYSEAACVTAGGVVVDGDVHNPQYGDCIVPVPPLESPNSDPVSGGYTYQFTSGRLNVEKMFLPHFATAYPFYYSTLDIPTGCAHLWPPIKGAPSAPPSCEVLMTAGASALNFFDKPVFSRSWRYSERCCCKLAVANASMAGAGPRKEGDNGARVTAAIRIIKVVARH
jgi:hypothetical protein